MSTGEGADGASPDWRELLRRHALDVWRSRSASPAEAGELTRRLEQALGAGAAQALGIVAAYAAGLRQQAGAAGADPPLEGLEVILAGIEATVAQCSPSAAPPRSQQIIQSELWQILRSVRESAELAYAREVDLAELDRRILFLLQNVGALVPADVSSAVGVDKAQVSRSVRRLLELDLVERQQIRSPLRLTRKGEGLTKRLLRLAELRNRELAFGIGEAELAEFFEVAEVLLERAMQLYEREREIAHAAGRERPAEESQQDGERRLADAIVIDRTRIVSPLMTLSAYFSRSGALAFRRLTGLSTFEAFVLSEIGMDPPVDWASLVLALRRDHSQAGRTVRALMERGLVERTGKPGRRHGRFFPTAEGARLHAVIHQAGRERSAFLLAPLEEQRRARFLKTVDKIRHNSRAQLERERALAALD